MRYVDETAIDAALNETYGGSPQFIDEEINTARFATDQDGVNWDGLHQHVWERASELRVKFRERPTARLTYFGGYPEVAAALALGAYIGEEWKIDPFDYREKTGWRWPVTAKTLELTIEVDAATLQPIEGPAILIVEVSAPIRREDVEQCVRGAECIATLRIGPAASNPQYADRVQSLADIEEIRRAIREALGLLLKNRPNVTTIHAFVAAQPSVAFAIGQELRLRNSRPIQTYRFRNTSLGPRMTAALLVTPMGPDASEISLTADERARAASLRTGVWASALGDIERYAALKSLDKVDGERWYDRLIGKRELGLVRPFPALPTVYTAITTGSIVEEEPLPSPNDYAFSRGRWSVSDAFLVQLDTALGGSEEQLRALVRMFLLHEASHKQHSLVKGKVDEVGKFPNCVERADYAADLYALLHEVDRGLQSDVRPLSSVNALRARIAELIDLIIRSFWAFERATPVARIEVRRLRRHLNWYWQQARVERADSLLQLFAILGRQPVIELAGMEQTVRSRRVYVSLTRTDPDVGLELGLVLDSEELWRVKDSATVELRKLLAAFSARDHDGIKKMFGRIFEDVAGSKHVLPDIRYL